MKRLVIVGTQWGDEGKGKITDYLAQKADVVVRYQGGNNAGHTVIFDGQKYSLHLLPSGILNPKIDNVLANGMVINPEALLAELGNLKNTFKMHISDRAHVIFPYHILLDRGFEATGRKIGTTHKGIGPAYTDKMSRQGIRMSTFIDEDAFPIALKEQLAIKNVQLKYFNYEPLKYEDLIDIYTRYAKQIKPFVKDTSRFLNQAIQDDQKILFEGAQGVLLCVDHGTYPYVTSSSPTAASVPLNTGIAPWLIEGAIGVTKAYTTRVGEGILPSEIHGELADLIRIKGHEFGTTTGRPRRIGWLDLCVLRHTKKVSGLSYLAVTLLDVLTDLDEIKVVTHYQYKDGILDDLPADDHELALCKPIYQSFKGWHEDITHVQSFEELPKAAQHYLQFIEKELDIPIAIFSVGPDRKQTITVKDIF
ncbi:MAG: adenylosuccinate synthase [Acholeplasmataceae bacterium]